MSIATGSSGLPGRCDATRKVPPCLMAPAAAAAVVSVPPAELPLVLVLSLSLPHAAMMALMNGTLSPITVPRLTNSRRSIRPWANASM